jgi:hypothetical protein
MKPTRAKEVLYDSEAMLRLVDRELQELRDDMTAPPSSHPTEAPAAAADAAQDQTAAEADPVAKGSPRAPRRAS